MAPWVVFRLGSSCQPGEKKLVRRGVKSMWAYSLISVKEYDNEIVCGGQVFEVVVREVVSFEQWKEYEAEGNIICERMVHIRLTKGLSQKGLDLCG